MLDRFPHLAQRLFNRPLMIHPAKAEIVVAALSERLGITHIISLNGEATVPKPMAFDQEQEAEQRAGSSYATDGYDVAFGVARLEVEGTLVNKLGSLRPYSGMSGYDGIRENFVRAMNDERVKAIMLEIDSPGGEVAGCFDLVDTMYSVKGRKPVWAVLNECAYSAGYAIACAADRITVPRTGGSGSIGIIWIHCDISQALMGEGIRVTFVTRGARKGDGAPEFPLSDEALAGAQRDIDTLGVLFEETVARNRSLSTGKIRDMQAATFLGAEGVSNGLADEVLSPADAFQALVESLD